MCNLHFRDIKTDGSVVEFDIEVTQDYISGLKETARHSFELGLHNCVLITLGDNNYEVVYMPPESEIA